MARYYFHLLIVLFVMLATTVLPSCDSRNISEVIRQMAETPVDTTGYSRRELRMSNFSSVKVDCFSDVTLHQIAPDEMPSIVLLAPDEVLDNVIAKVSEETLHLKLPTRYQMPGKVAVVAHIYAPFLSRIELNGSKCLRMERFSVACPLEIYTNGLGAIMADDIKAHDLFVYTNGAGSMRISGIKANIVDVECNGSGEVILEGQCRKGHVKANGVGLLNVSGLHSTQSSLQVNANGVGSLKRN